MSDQEFLAIFVMLLTPLCCESSQGRGQKVKGLLVPLVL